MYIYIYEYICISDIYIYIFIHVCYVYVYLILVSLECVYTYLCIHAYTNAQKRIDMHAYTYIHVTYACAIEYIHDVSTLVRCWDTFTYLHMFACASSLEIFMYMFTSVFRRNVLIAR